MSESDTDFEYTPRKSKKQQIAKPQKKQKMYTPKAQKQVKTKNYNTFNSEVDTLHDTKDTLLELIDILNTENVLKWDSNCEQLYKEYSLEEVEEYKKGYENIHYKIREDHLKKYYNRFWMLNIY